MADFLKFAIGGLLLLCLSGMVFGQKLQLKSRGFLGVSSGASDSNTESRLVDPVAVQVPLQGTIALDPKLLVQLLVVRNADVQRSQIQIEVAGHLRDAEAALYEGVLFGNVRREDRERQRSIVERQTSLATSNLALLDEQVRSGEAGARSRLPTGGEVSLSYKIRNTQNNIISTTVARPGEYDGALILTVKQPLLRGRGRDVIETDRKIAELEEKISVLQYKQQLLKTSNDALSIYWQFYRAIEIRRIREQALDNARKIVRDTESRVEAGRLSATNILESTSAAMVREVERIRAEQGVVEAESRLLTLLNLSGLSDQNLRLTAAQEPVPTWTQPVHVEERFQQALEMWPDYQIAKLRLEQGKSRLNYAENQRLPVLDLQLSGTNNGLAYDRSDANSIIRSGKYPEWIVALNLEVPLLGNQKANSQLSAQNARVRQSELDLEAVRNSLANDLRTRWMQLEAAQKEVSQLARDVEMRSQLFANERVRYEAGIGLLGQLLQRESDLNESRQRLVESNVRLGQAKAGLMFADGSLLSEYGITLKE